MAQKDSFIQKVFYEISLEKDPGLWQNDEDTTEKNIERIRLISGFPQTRDKAQLEKSNSTTKKNIGLAKALKEKGNKQYSGGDTYSALTLYNQALCFSRYIFIRFA
mgnify:CR=1 FL=1